MDELPSKVNELTRRTVKLLRKGANEIVRVRREQMQ